MAISEHEHLEEAAIDLHTDEPQIRNWQCL